MLTDLQYEYLKIFPRDKSYLSLKALTDLTGKDYGELFDTYPDLELQNLIEGALHVQGFRLTEYGLKQIKKYRRKEYMDANAYWRARYWWAIAIVSAGLGWLLKVIELKLLNNL